MMFNDSFPDTPYNDKMMDKAGAIGNSVESTINFRHRNEPKI